MTGPLGTERERNTVVNDARAIVEWGYQEYGDDGFGIDHIGGDVEEVANAMVEAVFDGDPERLRSSVNILRRMGAPRSRLRTARELVGRTGDWRL